MLGRLQARLQYSDNNVAITLGNLLSKARFYLGRVVDYDENEGWR